MKSQPERLNERLEEQLQARRGAAMSGKRHAYATSTEDEEIDELLEIAQYLNSTPHTQVDSQFAQRLERRIRAHAIHIQQARTRQPWWQGLLLHKVPKQIAIATIAICLLLGAGAIGLAAQAAPPSSPLYLIKSLEHKAQQVLAPSQLDKAEQVQQGVRDQLKVLKTLANPAQEKAYNHELLKLEQQLNLASQFITKIPDANDRSHANNELSKLKMEVNATLHDLLPTLNHAEQLATTNELNYQGEPVLHVKNASVKISASPHPQATITITGDSFQPGAQLFINNQLQSSTGTLQNGVYIFTVDWADKQQPATIALRNPDDTLAQTTMVTFSTGSPPMGNGTNENPSQNGNGDNGNDNNNSNGNDNSNTNGNSNANDNSNDNGNSNSNTNGNGNGNGSGNGNSNTNGNGNGGGNGNGSGNGNGNGGGNGNGNGNGGGNGGGNSDATP